MTVTHHTFALPGGKLVEYKEFGQPNLPAVVLMHGLSGDGVPGFITNFFAELPFRFISILRPGYGRSDMLPMNCVADWVKQLPPLFDHLNIKAFDIVGISAGAPYSYSLAALYPQLVKRIFIVSGVTAVFDERVMNTLDAQSQQFYRFVTQASAAEVARSIMDSCEPIPQNIKQLMAFDDAKVKGGLGMAREAKLQPVDWGFDLTKINHPIISVHSKTDEIVAFAAAQKTVELYFTNADFIVLDNEEHASEQSFNIIAKRLTAEK